jgi:hypothetical protein
MSGRRVLGSVLLVLGALLAVAAEGQNAEAKPRTNKQRAKTAGDDKSSEFRWCRLQDAQPFLKRRAFVRSGALQARPHDRALRYRVDKYGTIPGLEVGGENDETAYSQAKVVSFMGLPLQIHEKVAPALRCVERRIQKTCRSSDERYVARAIGGFRRDNTYRGGEVSNHMFGIAVDIDPDRNPCCGCVEPWPSHKACKDPGRTIYEKTELTKCWIDAFERYGFYWLGRDKLEDTMHFEFLGDPDRILPEQ